MEGHGILQSLDCVYVGDLCRNVRQGIGTMQHINGGKYSGQWYNDKRHGKGTTVEADGTVIEGQWKAGCMFGKCTISKRGGERVTVYCIEGGATVRYDKCIEAVTVVQKYIRQVFARREECRLRAEAAATTLSPEETLKQQLELLAKREKRLGVVTKTKPKAAPSVRAPARAAKSRRGGGNTRDKRTSPRQSPSPAARLRASAVVRAGWPRATSFGRRTEPKLRGFNVALKLGGSESMTHVTRQESCCSRCCHARRSSAWSSTTGTTTPPRTAAIALCPTRRTFPTRPRAL